ncbi:MAG: prolyl oligopeptidase family serine peptidase [Clostridiaceae bacterium]|nr:prolyl oligopeptidase family serine peptidase [Clostridiaceae bacterium]
MLRDIPGVLAVETAETPDAFADTTILYSICYESGGCQVMGYAALSKDASVPLPCIIYNRGGNKDFGYLRPESICRFAEKGFIVLGSQYRGNMGGTGSEEFGGADVDDVIKLIDIALLLPICKKDGVYMVGHSRGGMMTYLACSRDSRIKAAVVGAGLSDCFLMYETREQSMKDVFHELVGGGPDEKRDAFIARSATYWAEKIIPPMLICQGTDDWRVVPEQSHKIYQKLKDSGKECRLIIYDGADHSLRGTTFVSDAIQWLNDHPLGKKDY